MRENSHAQLANAYAGHKDLSPSGIVFLCVNDGKFISRIEEGAICTLRTYRRVVKWLSDHWPEGIEWPHGIPRPESSHRLKTAPSDRKGCEAAAFRTGKIHPGKKQLSDDDGDHSDILHAVAGFRSVADLDEARRRTVIVHLKAFEAEFRPATKSGLKRKPRAASRDGAAGPQDPGHAGRGQPARRLAEAILQRIYPDPHRVPLQWANSEQRAVERRHRSPVASQEEDREVCCGR
ncbi:MAG: hypothetical protein F4Y47_20060 [Acidobacteriia bacterium]|nr:hypothetical protein [Terriglobia bacterium]MYG02558.1 hypothetical protein [Terriglobia bacterium]MYK08031.1 hypothetical protein [Terriglobia bacterium]